MVLMWSSISLLMPMLEGVNHPQEILEQNTIVTSRILDSCKQANEEICIFFYRLHLW